MNKRPIIIEFSGLPNSGKTTLLRNLKLLCEKNNINAIFIQEAAELFPSGLPKGNSVQNGWITLETLQQLLEVKFMDSYDFIFMDRGFYNQLFWSTLYKDTDPMYSKIIENFMKDFDKLYDIKPHYIYHIDVSVEESIRRRMALGGKITFSNESFLSNYRQKFNEFSEKIDSLFYLDTTNLSKDEVAQIVFSDIYTLYLNM